MHKINYLFKRLVASISIVALLSNSAFAVTFTVNSASDEGDNNPGDGTCYAATPADCTFRAAVEEANALGGTNAITFSGNTTVVNTGSEYEITNNALEISNGGNTVNLDGNGSLNDGLRVNADDVVIDGINVYNFNGTGIQVDAGADDVLIQDNIIGLESDGDTANGNNTGINIEGKDATIDGNTISGNSGNGIQIDNGAQDVVITDNMIGTDSTGSNDRGNGLNGVNINHTGSYNLNDAGFQQGVYIGGSGGSVGNVISGNGFNGISTSGGGVLSGTITVQDNLIGVDSTGNTAIPNDIDGIHSAPAGNNDADWIIGSNGDGLGDSSEGNVISGNGGDGVEVTKAGSVRFGTNIVGLGEDGSTAVGNGGDGVKLSATGSVIVGSNNDGLNDGQEGNTIGNNNGSGVLINNVSSPDSVLIHGNNIGVDSTGSGDHGNNVFGVNVTSSDLATLEIGNSAFEGRNIIGNNGDSGIFVQGTASPGPANVDIVNNYIGLESDGSTDAGNTSAGIEVNTSLDGGVVDLTIGSDDDGIDDANEGNVISNNDINGIDLSEGVNNVVIGGNYIGVSDSGGENFNTAAGNSGDGVQINSSTIQSLVIGGGDVNERNVISGNSEHGISIEDATNNAYDITIQDNYIGLGEDGVTDIGNLDRGIDIRDGQIINLIANVIANSTGDGVAVLDGTELNFTENLIGTDSDGVTPAGNGVNGLTVDSSLMTSVVIGGAAVGNVFAASTFEGVSILGLMGSASTVLLQGNYIGVGGDGMTTAGLGNGSYGLNLTFGNITIGGDNDLLSNDLAEGNVISNNGSDGIFVNGADVSGLSILGNIIGLVANGSGEFDQDAGNADDGVVVSAANLALVSIGSTTGVTADSQRNIISGNGEYGLEVQDLAVISTINLINNYIGADESGGIVVGNDNHGINIVDGTFVNVGGTLADQGNVISGNNNGMTLASPLGIYNVLGNYIGVDVTGSIDLGNTGYGLDLTVGDANIGDGTVAGRNIISGNDQSGIHVGGGTADVLGNYVGLDATGESIIGNGENALLPGELNYGGVLIDGGSVSIGGGDLTDAGLRNVISGNFGHGILATNTSGLEISGNYIGTDKDGDTDLGNQDGADSLAEVNGSGIVITDINGFSIDDTVIGGNLANEGNVISGNSGAGIAIYHYIAGALGDGAGQDWAGGFIRNNLMGVAEDGVSLLDNDGNEIYLNSNSTALISGLSVGGPENVLNNTDGLAIRSEDVSIVNAATICDDNMATDIAASPVFNIFESYVLGVLDDACPNPVAPPVVPPAPPAGGGGSAGGGSGTVVVGGFLGTPAVAPQEDQDPVEEIEETPEQPEEVVEQPVVDPVVQPEDPKVEDPEIEDIVEPEVVFEPVVPVPEVVIPNEVEISREEVISDEEREEISREVIEVVKTYQPQEKFEIDRGDGEKLLNDFIKSGFEELGNNEEVKKFVEGKLSNKIVQVRSGGSVDLHLGRGEFIEIENLDDVKFAFTVGMSDEEIANLKAEYKSDGFQFIEVDEDSDLDADGVGDLLQLSLGLEVFEKVEADDISNRERLFFGLNYKKISDLPDRPEVVNVDGLTVGGDVSFRIYGPRDEEVTVVLINSETEEVVDLTMTEIEDMKGETGMSTTLKDGEYFVVVKGQDGYGRVSKFSVNNQLAFQNSEFEIEIDQDGVFVEGVSQPGKEIVISYKSVILNSQVIADASQGDYSSYAELPDGEHEVVVYAYDRENGLVGNVSRLIFRK